MKVDYKSFVFPVVAVFLLLYQAITGKAITSYMRNDIVNQVTAYITFGVTVWGIWKNHKKEVNPSGNPSK